MNDAWKALWMLALIHIIVAFALACWFIKNALTIIIFQDHDESL